MDLSLLNVSKGHLLLLFVISNMLIAVVQAYFVIKSTAESTAK